MSVGTRQPQRKSIKRNSRNLYRDRQDPRELAMLQPWFLPFDVATAIKRLIPREYQSRMLWIFEDYGCIVCHRKSGVYGGNGFCRSCHTEFRTHMMASIKKRSRATERFMHPKPKVRLVDSSALAREMLADLVFARSSEALHQQNHHRQPLTARSQKNLTASGARRGTDSSIALAQVKIFEE
jgi:hypothetical protein